MSLDRVLPRAEQLERMAAASSVDKPLDVLIIGGGASGAGCAVDAVSRCACGDRKMNAERQMYASDAWLDGLLQAECVSEFTLPITEHTGA